MAIAYVPFMPEPVEGQAILNDFTRQTRLLKYRDNDEVFTSISRGMPLYDVTLRETVGTEESDADSAVDVSDGSDECNNMVIRGECLAACAWLKKRIDAGERKPIDLVYIDPPFASGADYAKKIVLRRNLELAERETQAREELTDDEFRSFEEKMYGDIWNKERYLNWMYENLRAIKSVMAPAASIYVHLDDHIVHYVKILMDEIFGEDNFINQITWQRNFAHGDAGQGAKRFGRISDYILFYAMSDDFTFNPGHAPYDTDYVDRVFRYQDADGRRWQSLPITAPGGAAKGNPYFEFMGVSRYWRYTRENLERMLKEGRIVQTKPGAVPRQKGYLDESAGVPLQDIWNDIAPVQGQAGEFVNYATQKPEALLERIIKASSDEGMVVADFFGGSGTTAAVAAKTGRNFIHVDVGVNSIETVRDRLMAINPRPDFNIYEIQDGVNLFRNPVQTMDRLMELIPGLAAEPQLPSPWAGAFHTAKDGMVPVYIPNLADSGSKFLDKALAKTIIHDALPDLPGDVTRVVLYYVDVEDLDELKRFVREQNDTTITLELRDLKPLLTGTVMDDEFHVTLGPNDHGDLLEPIRITFTEFRSDRIESSIEDFNRRNVMASRKRFTPIAVSDNGLELIESVSLDCEHESGPWHSSKEIRIDIASKVSVDGTPTGMYWDGGITCTKEPKRIRVRNIAGDETILSLAEATV